jgi:cytohesin
VAFKNELGENALHEAAKEGHCNIVQLMLDNGLDPDVRTDDGDTPLSLAADGDFPAVVDMLLSLGCNVNNRDCDNETPVHRAAYNGNLEMVVKLVNAGANPDCRSKLNMSPLWIAVYKDSLKMVNYLLVKNVELEVVSRGIEAIDISYIYENPRSVLYAAIDWSSMDVVKNLVLAGYNIYQESWIMAHDFSDDNRNQSQKQQMLLHFASSPPTLQALCRNFLRRQFKMKVIECVNSLEVPENLKDCLLLKDFIAEEFYKM